MTSLEFRSEDSWASLRRYTRARIALGHAGASLPTREILAFRVDHARARDAVLRELDFETLQLGISTLGLASIKLKSRCRDKAEYLQRPDLGRRLSDASRLELSREASASGCDLAIVLADGLSSIALERHVLPFLKDFLPLCSDLKLGPLCLAEYSRVALSDEVGQILKAKAALILIGERPGLSSPDSMGAYLTFGPAVGNTDERRNCVSNIRPEGLPLSRAARKIEYLLREALARKLSGVQLKDEEAAELVHSPDESLAEIMDI